MLPPQRVRPRTRLMLVEFQTPPCSPFSFDKDTAGLPSLAFAHRSMPQSSDAPRGWAPRRSRPPEHAQPVQPVALSPWPPPPRDDVGRADKARGLDVRDHVRVVVP